MYEVAAGFLAPKDAQELIRTTTDASDVEHAIIQTLKIKFTELVSIETYAPKHFAASTVATAGIGRWSMLVYRDDEDHLFMTSAAGPESLLLALMMSHPEAVLRASSFLRDRRICRLVNVRSDLLTAEAAPEDRIGISKCPHSTRGCELVIVNDAAGGAFRHSDGALQAGGIQARHLQLGDVLCLAVTLLLFLQIH